MRAANSSDDSNGDDALPTWAVTTIIVLIVVVATALYVWWFYALFTFNLETSSKIAVIFVGLFFSPLFGVIAAYILRR